MNLFTTFLLFNKNTYLDENQTCVIFVENGGLRIQTAWRMTMYIRVHSVHELRSVAGLEMKNLWNGRVVFVYRCYYEQFSSNTCSFVLFYQWIIKTKISRWGRLTTACADTLRTKNGERIARKNYKKKNLTNYLLTGVRILRLKRVIFHWAEHTADVPGGSDRAVQFVRFCTIPVGRGIDIRQVYEC